MLDPYLNLSLIDMNAEDTKQRTTRPVLPARQTVDITPVLKLISSGKQPTVSISDSSSV